MVKFYFLKFPTPRTDKMYVQQKYGSFKEEIREYQNISVRHYQQFVLPKVTKYMDTHKARITIARTCCSGTDDLKYDVAQNSQITFNHLCALT